ncbi:MAG: leucyl aminopeptidase family protein [Litorimonas sp.]
MSLPICHLNAVPSDVDVTPIHILYMSDWDLFAAALPAAQFNIAKSHKFTAQTGQSLRLTDIDGNVEMVLFGAGEAQKDKPDTQGPMALGGLSRNLSSGYYTLSRLPHDWSADLAAIAWGMGVYKFNRYLSKTLSAPTLVLADGQDLKHINSAVSATKLCRDLINTPASDMGPVALHEAAVALAQSHGAQIRETVGQDLLEHNFPMIHAVGRAAHEDPRLVEFEWGNPEHPRLALIGKGITFDTGGVNMKSATGARLMKKDMGGAAHALALAHMIMENNLPIRLHCLVAIAENSVSAGAYRPGDILKSRTGLSIEIDNTDAEGRLVLGDALCRAAEDNPVLMIDFATLTGAARVALGPHLPPFFSNRQNPVKAVLEQSTRQHDPVWHMPLWQPYLSMLSSPIADMKNAGGGFAGSVTAALFLEKFVKNTPWMHFDVYGWNPTDRASHPVGGDMYAVRGLFSWLMAGGLNGDFSG